MKYWNETDTPRLGLVVFKTNLYEVHTALLHGNMIVILLLLVSQRYFIQNLE